MESYFQMRTYIFITIVACFIVTTKATHELGCFREQIVPVYFSLSSIAPGDLTPAKCIESCSDRSNDYAILRAGRSCFCSMDNPATTLTPDSGQCNIPCTGDPTQTCGDMNHVYAFGVKSVVTGTLSLAPSVVATGDVVAIVTDIEPPGLPYKERVSYDSGEEFSDWTMNSTDLSPWSWSVAGSYQVISEIQDDESLFDSSYSAHAVDVISPAFNLTLACPASAVTFDKLQIPMTLSRGTGYQLDIYYQYNADPLTLHQTIVAADVREKVLGNSVVPAFSVSSVATNGLVIHHARPAEFDGYLAGLEYYAVNAGTLTVYIYRPTFPTGEEYCDFTHDSRLPTNCQASCDAQGYCSSKQDCCSGPTNPSTTLLSGITYSMAHSVNVPLNPGHGYIDLTANNINLVKGDVLAHDATGTLLLASKPSDFSIWSDYYCNTLIGAPSFLDTACTVTSEFHMLGGVYVEESSILYDMTFSLPGLVTLQVDASHSDIPNVVSDSCSISLVEGVNASIIQVGEYIPKGENVVFSVGAHTGFPTTTYWDFGDGGTDAQPYPGDATYPYPNIGTYNLTANVTNAASYKFNFITVHVEERITGFALMTTGGVEVNIVETLTVAMTAGTNFSCDFKITDGNGAVTKITIFESLSINYTFTEASMYTIAVNCSNHINQVSDVRTVQAVERLTGLALAPQGAIANSFFKFVLSWATGSDVTLNYFRKDGVEVPMVIDHVNKIAKSVNSYQVTATGNIAITYEISNPLSTITEPAGIFVIEVPITNPDINCQFPTRLNSPNEDHLVVIGMGGQTSCTVTMTDGSSVQVIGDWGDGTPTVHSGASGEPWSTTSAGIPFPIDHTYSNPGTYDMKFSVSNNYSEVFDEWKVMVMQGVSGITLKTLQDTKRFDPPATLEFFFDTLPTPLPNSVTLDIQWGDGTTDTIVDIDLQKNLNHTYQDKDGNLTVTYTLSNLFDSQSGSLPVYIVAPIENMLCYVEPKAGLPGVPVDLKFKAGRAPPKDVLELTFDCNTLVAGTEPMVLRANNSPDGVDTYTCPPYVTGSYTMSVEAKSRLETLTCTHNFKVLNGVTNEFTVSSNAPIDYDNVGQTCDLTINLSYYGLPFPDEAEVYVDFDDGVGSTNVSLIGASTTINYSYSQTGHYTSTMIIWNDASSETYTFNTGCYSRFTTVQYTPMREPIRPLISPDLVGFGINKKNFRTDETIKLHTSISAGTFVYWQVTAEKSDLSNIITCNNTNEDVISLVIDQPGLYTVKITAVNPIVSSVEVSHDITMFNPVRGIQVSEFNTTPAAVPKTFQVDMESYGTDMCVAVHYGEPFDTDVYTYGDAATCADIFTYMPTEFPGFLNASYTFLDVSQAFNLTSTYQRISTYTMKIFAWNEFTQARGNFTFAISGLNCSTPQVTIVDWHPNVTDPVVKLRSRRNMIKTVSDMRCPETLKNNKFWRVYRVNETTGDDMDEVNIDALTSRMNSEFAIDPKFLTYGLYKCSITVTMETEKETDAAFSTSIHQYIRIVKSPLSVQLDEYRTSLDSVAVTEQVTLDPTLYSYDPDEDVANFDWFEMECRCITDGESFTTNEVDVYVAGAPIGHTDIGGCFQTGPGKLKGVNGKLTFSASIFTVGKTYEFRITGYKDTRSASFKYRISAVAMPPPHAKTSFKIPKIFHPGPSGLRFNPTTQLGFEATITNYDPQLNYTYLWQAFAQDYQFCNCCDCWRPLDYLHQYIEGNDGVHSAEFTIHTALFTHYNTVDEFKVDLSVSSVIGGTSTTGLTSLFLTRNRPPNHGSCTISPSSGTAAQTNFFMECSGFYDDDEDDEVADYLIKCNSKGEKWIALGEGETPQWNMMLPPGDPNNSNILKCSVIVKDDKGSYATYAFPDVTVNPLSVADFTQWLEDSVNSDQDIFKRLESSANLDTTVNVANVMSVLIGEFNNDAENSAYKGIQTASSMVSTDFLQQNAIRTNAFESGENETQEETYQKDRANIASVVEQVVGTFEKVTKDSIEEITDVTEALLGISDSITTTTLKSQKTITDLFLQAERDIANNRDDVTVEVALELQERTSGSCANIQQTANILHDFPTTLDIEAQDINVPFFDTSKKSDVEEIPIVDDDNLQKELGKKNLHQHDQYVFLPELVSKCSRLADQYTALLSEKTVSAQTLEMHSKNSEMKIFNAKSADITGTEVKIGTGSFIMPSFTDDAEENIVVVAQASSSPKGPWGPNNLVNRHSQEFSIKVHDRNGKKKKIDNVKFVLKIPQDSNKPKFDESLLNYTYPQIMEGEFLFYEAVNVSLPGSSVRMTYRPSLTGYFYQHLVIVSSKDPPFINKHGQWENVVKVCMIPSNTMFANKTKDKSGQDPYSCFVRADEYKFGEPLLFGSRELRADEFNYYESIDNLPTMSKVKQWKNDSSMNNNYKSWSNVITCGASSDDGIEQSSEGLIPLASSTENMTHCETKHLTTFGGGWAVAPNTIDWNFIFSNADFLKNPTLYVTEIVIALVYIIAMIWARRKDRQDVEKLGLAPLPCNEKQDRYYYEIMVSTGMRRGAGTDSKVHFVLSGEEEETDVRTFEDKKRKIFERGNTDGFLMSVPYSLGALMYLRIWHDNSGKGRMASWYLNHVIVRDVQTEKKYYFIANRWFAVEEDDGQVDRVIPVAGKEQMTQFSHLFSEKATKNLSDGHLWFSVVARPPQSRFTRCQRVSCCLCLLYSSMLANAMFYGTETADSNAFTFGPFALTSKQIFIGIVCNIIVFPVNFLLIHLFRKSRPRKLRPSRLEQAIKSSTERSTSMADVNPRVQSSLDCERPGSSFLLDAKRSTSAMSRPETSMSSANADSKKKKKCELPWWFTIVAWIILWLCVLTSAAFVTFYGISFQDMKCKKWITSMLISFFTSVFLTQPIKVFLFAIIFSLIIKNPGSDEDEDDDEEAPKNIECDEEYLHEEDEFAMIAPRKPVHKPKPLNTKALETARKQRLKEIQMWAVIREILFYAFFLWILLVISYRSVNSSSYTYKHNMEKVFILTNDTNKSFFKIKNTPDFWAWAQSGMLRGLRAGPYYNNFPPFYMRGYINDKTSRLMGPAVLRQVRIRPNTCTLPGYIDGIIEECNGLSGISLEQEEDFGAGWVPLTGNNSREEYKYRTAAELDGYPYWGESAMYGGGGYIVNLDADYFTMINHLKQLEQEGWVDKYTRAVFLEFTVYNPSINLFSISTLVSEFRPSGGVFPTYRFEPCNLLPYMNSGLLLQIACEIIYFIFTVFFVITLFRNLYKQKTEYFYQFWNLVDLGICAMSVTAIVIYFYRLVCINTLTEYFQETAGDGYIKFQYVGYWSEIFNYIIGFLVFFATLKFLKLLRFNRKISLLSDTLKNSSKDLINFSLIFNVTFLAFIQVFYLVYMSHLDTFKTFLGSCEAGIVMMMGKFDIYNMLAVNQWMTQIFIFLFVVTITFIVVNMLLSILNDTFTAVRNDKNKQKNDYEIVEFMMGRFKMWTGIGRSNPTISPAELEKQRKAKSIEDQVDQLPDQIDRFLASISNMYIGDAKFDSFLQKGIAKKMAMKAKAHENDPADLHPAPALRVPGSQRLSHGLSRGMTDVQTD